MKRRYIYILIVILVIILGFGALYGLTKDSKSDSKTTLTAGVSSQTTLLDVRTPAEFNQSHAKGAVNFDVTRLQQGEMPNIDKASKIKVYCRSGRRAGEAKTILQQNGFKDVENIGGLEDWQKQGGQVVGNS